MKRREFLSLSKTGLIVVSCSPLVANTKIELDEHIKDSIDLYTQKSRKDIILSGKDFELLKKVTQRIKRVQQTVGHGNFNLISFDGMLSIAKRYSKVGAFTKEEKTFLESVFYKNANEYGFFGDKVLHKLTTSINKKEIKKIPYTGHYLYNGESRNLYNKIRKEVGKSVILTSGIRGIAKQMYLFLNKSIRSQGNLSEASQSLAPPGYSFHGVGDFDVGKVGYGYRNFTADFAKTDEFKKLIDSGYIDIRYPENNPFGVRYEPWHIKINKKV